MKKLILLMLVASGLYSQDSFYYKNGKKVTLIPKKRIERSVGVIYYQDKQGNELGINREILVKLKDDQSIKPLLEKYAISLKEKITENIYIVTCKDVTLTLDTANRLYGDSSVIYAHPNFLRKKVFR